MEIPVTLEVDQGKIFPQHFLGMIPTNAATQKEAEKMEFLMQPISGFS